MKKFNKPLTAVLLSIIGGLPAGIFSSIMKHFHLTNITSLESTSMMYIRQGSMTLGILSAIGFATVLGLIIYYSAAILGTDYFPIKSMILTMLAESILFIVFGTLANNPNMIQDVTGNYIHAASAALSGLFRGFLMKKYLFNQ